MKLGIRGQLGIFSALFAAGMWMSKIAQPLYFEQRGALVAFGIGYAVMAVAGGFSFIWGVTADRIGGLWSVRIGTALYGIGIAGRIFTDTVPVIVFSAISGVGASMAMVAIRPWVRSTVTQQEIPRVVGARNLGNQTGVLIGTVGASAIFALSLRGSVEPAAALIIAPVLIVAAFIWVLVCPVVTLPGEPVGASTGPHQAPPDRRGRYLALRLTMIGLLSGFYISLTVPYLPLVFTDSGASASQSALVIGMMSVVQMGISWILARRKAGFRPLALFIVSEISTGLLTLAAVLALGLGPGLLAVIFIARAAFVSLAVVAEETIQYAVMPRESAGFMFGISQTAFLVGDALGGAVGAPLWIAGGAAGLLTTAGIITLVNALVLPLLLKRMIPKR
ncbi:MFS transporter [Mycetocola lacteus]|uniref:MFS transporter n=1 Tax=Mycetocola lacteus TaxID=76637 RepID=A0A3L7ASC8_9MICO|nr:MFS transporter [Mycetocola lacteus]RLP82338.1 MFS transporter [Mycetocola lacteus]